MAGNGYANRRDEEPSVSRTLGSNDTISDAPGVVNGADSVQNRILNPLSPFHRKVEGEECRLKAFASTNGVADLGAEDVYEFEEERSFSLLGKFAGRFPGIKATEELANSWRGGGKVEALLNGHVMFCFKKEEDRDAVLSGGPYAVYGKRLFLCLPPENFGQKYEDYSFLPIWVRLPGLPVPCWHENALGKIASCFGKPLYMDRVTKRRKRHAFARLLVEVDCSILQPKTILVKMPNGVSFEQSLSFEKMPMFCARCGSIKHVTTGCPLSSADNPKERAEGDTEEVQQPVCQDEAAGKDGSLPYLADGVSPPVRPVEGSGGVVNGEPSVNDIGGPLVINNSSLPFGVPESSRTNGSLPFGVPESSHNDFFENLRGRNDLGGSSYGGGSDFDFGDDNEIDDLFNAALGIRNPEPPRTGKQKKKKKKNNKKATGEV